ncbi:MAG: hypothetical protein CM1200mP14_02390 [Gammaproteobacteria bacterium]|nr:MAG: hypothetical protein CM1200mP14_02390 [Gammaproteobacteria bacterium]
MSALGFFCGESLIRLPVTHDVYVVEMAVDEMEVGLLTDGTDIAGAIAAGAGLLRDTPHTSKVLILVTDGAHNKAGSSRQSQLEQQQHLM